MVNVHTQVPEEWREQLLAKAEASDRSLSSELRRAIRSYLQEKPAEVTAQP